MAHLALKMHGDLSSVCVAPSSAFIPIDLPVTHCRNSTFEISESLLLSHSRTSSSTLPTSPSRVRIADPSRASKDVCTCTAHGANAFQWCPEHRMHWDLSTECAGICGHCAWLC